MMNDERAAEERATAGVDESNHRRGRRRPRTFSSSSRRDDAVEDDCAYRDDNKGGGFVPNVRRESGLGRGGPNERKEEATLPREARAFSPSTRNDNDDHDRIDQIDAILDERRKAASGGGEGKEEGETPPPLTTVEEEDELLAAHRDVFGRPPPSEAWVENRLLELEIEASKLHRAESRALNEALRKHPLLFVTSSHTKMILRGGDEDEDANAGEVRDDFDAAAAARRLARYWESRLALLGQRLCYGPGVFGRKEDLAAYQRYEKRLRVIVDDPRSDGMLRRDAEMMLDYIERGKVEALDAVLRQMDHQQDQSQESNAEHHAVVAAEASRERSARRLARESSTELKLQFLRVEDMIESRAAQRLVRYWETGLRLFGPVLERNKRVTLNDLKDCAELFDLHLFRLMPEDDDFGRSIIVPRSNSDQTGKNMRLGDLDEDLVMNGDNFAKVLWYILHVAMERKSCQRNGFVMVADARVRDSNWKKRRLHREAMTNVLNCVPVKFRALHLWFDHDFSWWRRQFLRGVCYVAGKWLQRRIVVHTGTTDAVLAVLGREFGIGSEKLPSNLGGEVEAEYFSSCLEDRRAAGL